MGARTGTWGVWNGRGARIAAAVVVALAATAPSALAKKPAPKPDLKIEEARSKGAGGPFVFQGQSEPLLDLEDTTRNTTDEFIADTEIAVYLEHGTRHWLLGRREIHGLHGKHRSSGTDETVDAMDFPIGAYTVVF